LCTTCAAIPAFLSPKAVQPVFTTFNFLLLPPWVLMIVRPKADLTKKLIKSNVPMAAYALIFVYLFIAATVQTVSEGNSIGEQILFLFTDATAGA
jgi:Domain of unknown function (DUF4281)